MNIRKHLDTASRKFDRDTKRSPRQVFSLSLKRLGVELAKQMANQHCNPQGGNTHAR